jgi:hypothetical protein
MEKIEKKEGSFDCELEFGWFDVYWRDLTEECKQRYLQWHPHVVPDDDLFIASAYDDWWEDEEVGVS